MTLPYNMPDQKARIEFDATYDLNYIDSYYRVIYKGFILYGSGQFYDYEDR